MAQIKNKSYRLVSPFLLMLCCIMLIVFVAPGSIWAAPKDISQVSGAAKITRGLLQKLQKDIAIGPDSPEVRPHKVIVGLYPVETEIELKKVFENKTKTIKFRDNIQKKQAKVLEKMLRSKSKAFKLVNRYENIYGFSALVDADAVEELVGDAAVAYVEEMPIHYKTDAEAFALTDTDQAHAAGWTGDGVTIAIIDDGIEHDHPAFGGYSSFPNAKILGGHDYADDDSDPTIDCSGQSHGTATSGVAAGNGGGVTGTAPDANLVFLKIQSDSICGEPGLDGDVAGSIDWVISNRETHAIKVISMSFSSALYSSVCPNYWSTEANAIRRAQDAGIVLVASSGNNAETNKIAAPSCHPDVISVGAVYDENIGFTSFSGLCIDFTTSADKVSCYSNSASILDVLAPAHCAFTADTGGATQDCFGGTSSSAPYVAGVIATFFERAPGLTWDNAKAALLDNGDPVTDSRNSITRPRVNHIASLDALGSQNTLTVDKAGSGTGTVSSSPSGIDCGSDCTETYNNGTEVTLSATPDTGDAFTGWSGGGCSGTGDCVVTMDQNRTITATFSSQYDLTVSKAGSGSGTVSSSPSGIDCGSDCTETYVDGTVVTLAGTPDGGSILTDWTGGGCSGSSDCQVTMDQTQDVTATFDILDGDINQDSALDVADAIIILQIVSGMQPAVTIPASADINSDGKIDLAEALYALQVAAGFPLK